MDSTSLSIIIYVAGLIFVIVMARLFSKPIKIILRLCLNSVLGCVIIVLVNTFTTIQIGINPITAAVCGVLGLPGAALLVALKLLI